MTDETISDKVNHVKSAKQHRLHACHWPGCTAQVAPALWGCRRHWYALPKTLRNKIWATYRIGQEETQDPSAGYLAVTREVQAWIKGQNP